MWPAKLCLVAVIFQCVFAGPFPQFRSEWEFLSMGTDVPKDWWQVGSFYQIYPRSFKDSDGDGIGDLNGITEMLPYLKEIGVTATWLSPIFKSPMKDFGYDISDFYDIQPEYGNMTDFKALVKRAKELKIKLILDFVPNHSSDECEWFKKSENREKGFEDFYVWADGKTDPTNSSAKLPPSNWVSVFRGSAWRWSDKRKQYYFHQFLYQQPDLNFRNPKVVAEMKNVLKFWLDLGVDGFRIDAVPHLFEKHNADGTIPDEPRDENNHDPDDYGYLHHIYTVDQPETLDMLYQWRALLDEYKGSHQTETKVLLAETWSPIDIIMKYYGNGTSDGAHIPFNFLFITQLNNNSNANDFVSTIEYWMNHMPEHRTPNWVMGNHDKSRVGSRLGQTKIDLMNIVLLTLPGASVNYYGEEIGMTDVSISWQDTKDPAACRTNSTVYKEYSRDPQRTPFQWSDAKNCGFSNGPVNHTWLPISPTYKEVNVKKQRMVARSHLNVYKQLQDLRTRKTLQFGDFIVKALNDNILAFLRSVENEESIVTVVNVGPNVETVDLTKLGKLPDTLQYVVVGDQSIHSIGDTVQTNRVTLLPNEAFVLESKAKFRQSLGYYYYKTD